MNAATSSSTATFPLLARVLACTGALIVIMLFLAACGARVEFEPTQATEESPAAEDAASPAATSTREPTPIPAPEPTSTIEDTGSLPTATATPEPVPAPATAVPAAPPTVIAEGERSPSGLPWPSSVPGYAVTRGRPVGSSADGSAVLVSSVSRAGGQGCEGAPDQAIWRVPLDGSTPTEEVPAVLSAGVIAFVVSDGWAVWTEGCDGYVGDYRQARIADDGRFSDIERVALPLLSEGVSAEVVGVQRAGQDIEVVTGTEVITIRDGAQVETRDLEVAAWDYLPESSWRDPVEGFNGSTLHWTHDDLVMVVPGPGSEAMPEDLVARDSDSGIAGFEAKASLPNHDGRLGTIPRDDGCHQLAVQYFDGRFVPLSSTPPGVGIQSVRIEESGKVLLTPGCGHLGGGEIRVADLAEILDGGTTQPVGPWLAQAPSGMELDEWTDDGVEVIIPWSEYELDGDDLLIVNEGIDRLYLGYDGSARVIEATQYNSRLQLRNNRFGFVAAVPEGWSVLPPATNGDGMVMVHESSGSEARIFGTLDTTEAYANRNAETIAATLGTTDITEQVEQIEFTLWQFTYGTVVGEKRVLTYSQNESAVSEYLHFPLGRAVVVVTTVPDALPPNAADDAAQKRDDGIAEILESFGATANSVPIS